MRNHKTPKRVKRAARAVSLVEILVCIAILIVVAAIVFPIMASAKRKALMASCQGTLSQLYKTAVLYAGDYDGYLPPYSLSGNDNRCKPDPEKWVGALLPYSGGDKVFYCPADKHARTDYIDLDAKDPMSSKYTSYHLTEILGEVVDGTLSLSLDKSPRSTSWPLLVDRSEYYGPNHNPYARGYHGNQINMVFMDGHLDVGPVSEKDL